MLLRLVITEGPRKGEEVTIRDTVVLGRKGDLNLQDPKVSSQHAKIFITEAGEIKIQDLNSSNGTFVNDLRIETWPLKVGDKIQVGRTVMKVEDEPSPDKPSEKGTWQQVVESELSAALAHLDKNPPKITTPLPFEKPVKLHFEAGLQSGHEVTFGFGPRLVGRFCPDCILFERDAPGIAFELHPHPNSLAEIRTSGELKINGTKVSGQNRQFRQKLKNGDRISIGQTVIVVKE